MKKRTLIIIVISVAVIFSVVSYVVSQLPKHDSEEIEKFQNYKADFEAVNNYFIKAYGDSPADNKVHLDKRISQIIGLYDEEAIKISEELKTSLNAIVPAFENYDFSFINVNEERISYCGDGYRMYVYSRNGKAPSYYYYKGDGPHPKVYSLGDNWYLLTNYKR